MCFCGVSPHGFALGWGLGVLTGVHPKPLLEAVYTLNWEKVLWVNLLILPFFCFRCSDIRSFPYPSSHKRITWSHRWMGYRDPSHIKQDSSPLMSVLVTLECPLMQPARVAMETCTQHTGKDVLLRALVQGSGAKIGAIKILGFPDGRVGDGGRIWYVYTCPAVWDKVPQSGVDCSVSMHACVHARVTYMDTPSF